MGSIDTTVEVKVRTKRPRVTEETNVEESQPMMYDDFQKNKGDAQVARMRVLQDVVTDNGGRMDLMSVVINPLSFTQVSMT